MSNAALASWIRWNMPETYQTMVGMSPLERLEVLNALTGLEVSPIDEMERSSARFLAALKQQQPHYWDMPDTLPAAAQVEPDTVWHITTDGSEPSTDSPPLTTQELKAIANVESIREAERERIRAELAKLAPTETQYTRLEWRYEEKGAQRMFDKVMAVFDAPAKKGGE